MQARRDALNEALAALKRYDLSGRITVDWDRPVGHGGTSDVYQGVSRGEKVAVKRTRFGPLNDPVFVKARYPFSLNIQRITC